ncbi:hypothetical protein QCE47_02750 [Caballeronia sp. LZ025]|uniref:hypothetical protein n=1 Tax=Caballeronia TaxID=1827195 RepID=UPI001FD3D1E1|nr:MULTISPECIES: hypothetical protein [Caballeronia]MDR5731269.1 hypothetical protein [Caballeronia sp. LZ025]
MLAADAVSGHAMELVRDGRGWIKSIESRFERLCNFVSADNDAAIAWLLSLGFNLGEVIPEHGAAKAPFRLFFKDADHV